MNDSNETNGAPHVEDQVTLSPAEGGASSEEEHSNAESFSRTRPDAAEDLGLDVSTLDVNGDPREVGNDSRVESRDDLLQDDVQSVQGSMQSSPLSPSQNSTLRSHRPHVLRPFDRRFSSLSLLPGFQTVRSSSPAFLSSHSRQSSLGSTVVPGREGSTDTPQPPWEVVRWSKLKRISGQLFSESGRRNFGRPTVMVVATCIVIGTSKGLALVYDYHQNLAATIGLGTIAVECGKVTALAISADYSTVACGHATGHIFTWEISRPGKPFLHIPPIGIGPQGQRNVDSHVTGSAVVHIGFLGTRRTALASADARGMAFSHLATRGLGAVARTVKTLRILGRYPLSSSSDKPRKASSVLAFAPLPLGNVEHQTDSLGLVALLTPYLLAIVSTTPIAETHYKAPRPKDVPPHSTLSGCLAWFPAVKLKRPIPGTETQISKTKLAYSWCNILTVLDVEAEDSEENAKPPSLQFHPRSRFRANESIVAVQWLTRSVLGILTISQRLLIVEDWSLRITDTLDMLNKHLYHTDVFSTQLRGVVEQLDDEDEASALHGVVADAYYMSFRAHKGRIFLLGFNDVCIGTLSNWADRLLALFEEGEPVAAIKLAESYYSGVSDKITVGLPEDDSSRHDMVKDKLLQMVSGSLKHVLSSRRVARDGIDEASQTSEIKELANASFSACAITAEYDVLFEEVFEAFREANSISYFFETLEPYILEDRITSLPPEVFKCLIEFYSSQDQVTRLEEMICRLDTRTMDIDQSATLCKRYRLYDAMIHIWNDAIGDYITPLLELLQLVKMNIEADELQQPVDHKLQNAATKIFPYLACVLTGQSYPRALDLSEEDAMQANKDIYQFSFSSTNVEWPPRSGVQFKTTDHDEEPSYPYLTLILRFDAPSFLSMLNEAFEFHFLNGGTSDSIENSSTNSLIYTRQIIITILLDVMGDGAFDSEDTIYLDMFIARNIAKFPQFIILPGNTLDRILERLCDYPSEELKDDAELSAEYLLSLHRPSNLPNLLATFRKVGFYRVLKSIFQQAKMWPDLVLAYLEDPQGRHEIFSRIRLCFRYTAQHMGERRKLEGIIVQNAQAFVAIDARQAALVLSDSAPWLIGPVFENLEEGSFMQFVFLQTLLDPKSESTAPLWLSPTDEESIRHKFEEIYVLLMCSHLPSRVADYIGLLKTGDLRLDEVIPAMESAGVIDAEVILMSREGLGTAAMQRLKKHMLTLEGGLTGLIAAASESPDLSNTSEAVEALVEDVQKYTKVGIWLCQGQTQSSQNSKEQRRHSSIITKKALKNEIDPEKSLNPDELLWLELIDAVVSLTKNVSAHAEPLDISSRNSYPLRDTILKNLRATVQLAFTALLSSTARPLTSTSSTAASQTNIVATRPRPTSSNVPQPHPSFLLILRAFLNRASASSPTLAHLRAVLAEIFQAYAHEERILELANSFLGKDLFVHVEEAWLRRQRGWRPRGMACEGCGRRAWGPGVGGGVWRAWERRTRAESRHVAALEDEGMANSQGKRRVEAGGGNGEEGTEEQKGGNSDMKEEVMDPLVVFACRHVWHRGCVEKAMDTNGLEAADGGREFRCPAGHGPPVGEL